MNPERTLGGVQSSGKSDGRRTAGGGRRAVCSGQWFLRAGRGFLRRAWMAGLVCAGMAIGVSSGDAQAPDARGVGRPEVYGGGFADPRDLVTLHRDMPLDQALRVIRVLSGQVIVDPQHLTVPIGLTIDREPWRNALHLIARRNGMEVWQRENFFELMPATGDSEAVGAGPSDLVTLDSREVLISAVFFQADRRAIRELGIDWTSLSRGRVDVRASQAASDLVSRDLFSIGVRGRIGGSLSVEALLKTFEAKNIGEVLANPQIKVQSGNQGYMQVGSDFSVVTSDFAGNAISQFFSTGTILTVTPIIRTEEGVDFVDLEVEAERSALVDPVRNLVSKTVARTSALLRDGEQTAIGGLYGQETTESRTGIPFLKDMPPWFFGLRYVFGHESKQVSKTELIVLLKVNIVPSVRQRIDGAQMSEGRLPSFERSMQRIDEILNELKGGQRTAPEPRLPSEEPIIGIRAIGDTR